MPSFKFLNRKKKAKPPVETEDELTYYTHSAKATVPKTIPSPSTRRHQPSSNLKSSQLPPTLSANYRLSGDDIFFRAFSESGEVGQLQCGIDLEGDEDEDLQMHCKKLCDTEIDDSMMNLVELQSFNGSWRLISDFASILQKELEYLEEHCPVTDTSVWATILAITYLQKRHNEKKDMWLMIEKKAIAWLETQNLEGKSVESLIQMAVQFV